MNDAYEAALDYLYGFINLEQKPIDRYQASKIDTTRTRDLLAALGDPQLSFPAIHIAGTKGKGSVAAMCASCLQAAGLRVGLYTSPHLRDFRERIRILTPADPVGLIEQDAFVARVDDVRPLVEALPGITWFEIVTAIAFHHFATEGVDILVAEVGLGGRLDATNVLLPDVSVITSLSLDHTQLLGNTLAEIAYEKGGIIKPGIPVVTAPQEHEALAKLTAISDERGSPLTLIGRDWQYDPLANDTSTAAKHGLRITLSQDPEFIQVGAEFRVALAGDHQLLNATVAMAALQHVSGRFPTVNEAAVRAGLEGVRWDGRLELLATADDQPAVLIDCAHNVASASRLADALTTEFSYERLILVFGAPEDKNIAGMMDILFPLADEIVLTTANHPRSASPEWLAEQATGNGYDAISTASTAAALELALSLAGPGDMVCVTGSIIVVGDLLNHWDSLQSPSGAHG